MNCRASNQATLTKCRLGKLLTEKLREKPTPKTRYKVTIKGELRDLGGFDDQRDEAVSPSLRCSADEVVKRGLKEA